MARAIHITVNLLLIVAVTIQPGLAYGLQQDCSAGATSEITCQGCRSCRVQSETAERRCCSREEGGCCGHDHQHKDRVATFANDAFAGMELNAPPVPEDSVPEDSEQPCDHNQPYVQAAGALTLAVACHCVTAPEPFDAPAPRSTMTELRDVLTVSVAYGAATLAARPTHATSFDVAHCPVTPHFSQIAFCVWRI